MTVAELIEKLKGVDPALNVVGSYDAGGVIINTKPTFYVGEYPEVDWDEAAGRHIATPVKALIIDLDFCGGGNPL